jgi:predicted RNA-binding protein with RPS1 domain
MADDPNPLPESQPNPAMPTDTADGNQSENLPGSPPSASKQRILIGSQRDPVAYRRRIKRDWDPIERKRRPGKSESPEVAQPQPSKAQSAGEAVPVAEAAVALPVAVASPAAVPVPGPAAQSPEGVRYSPAPEQPMPQPTAQPVPAEPGTAASAPVAAAVQLPQPPPQTAAAAVRVAPPAAPTIAPSRPTETEPPDEERRGRRPSRHKASEGRKRQAPTFEPPQPKKFPPPSLRGKLSADLAQEFEEALSDVPLDDLLAADAALTSQPGLELESKRTGRVLRIHRDDVFIELGGREQGIAPLRQFAQPPEPGAMVEVVVTRFNAEDGLYELSLPEMAADVEDWSDLSEGMLVEARVTGHNTGGLECEVNHIRGFIPVSQIALYRVEDLAEFVDQKFNCLVTECNPNRGNLVLSRRAVLEKEREEARKQLLESLQPGQVCEGVVRKLMDFGAFVELGSGVDGLLHVSQLSWARVEHPREVLHEGQTIQVKIDRVDKDTGRISLGYREMQESPWARAAEHYPANSLVRARVTKLMEFGAFVQVEPGVEGLVHISELSHKRVWRTSDVVKEGDEVEVLVLSVDPAAQRMSLSMKQALPQPEPEKKQAEQELPETAPPPKKPRPKSNEPLRGGLGGPSGGDRFGLRW